MSAPEDIRARLSPYTLDGTEAVEALVALTTSYARPPDLRSAIRKTLERQYRDCVPLDAVIDLIDPERIKP